MFPAVCTGRAVPTRCSHVEHGLVNRAGNVYGMSWLPGTATTGVPRLPRSADARSCCSGRPRWVRSPLATTRSGFRRSTSVTSEGPTSGLSRAPTCRSETWRTRAATADPPYKLDCMTDEPAEIVDDLYLGLRAGGALRKQRRGEPLTAEEEEALGRWRQMSSWRKVVAIGAFAVGTFGLGFTLGGLIFGRWRRA